MVGQGRLATSPSLSCHKKFEKSASRKPEVQKGQSFSAINSTFLHDTLVMSENYKQFGNDENVSKCLYAISSFSLSLNPNPRWSDGKQI